MCPELNTIRRYLTQLLRAFPPRSAKMWSLPLLPFLTNATTSSTMLQMLSMTSAFTIPILAILVLVVSRMLLKYGAAIIGFIGKLRPAFISVLQIMILIACAYNLAFPAANVLRTVFHARRDGVTSDCILRIATAVFTAAGMVLAAVVGVYVVEIAAANQTPDSLGQVMSLRPLRFGKSLTS